MRVVADTSVILDFLDGLIEDPAEIIRPHRLILISPVVLHEVLRGYPKEHHPILLQKLRRELLPIPTMEHWIESAQVIRELYFRRQKQNVARMQNDVLIALSAREINAPIWSRDTDFDVVCKHLGVGQIKEWS